MSGIFAEEIARRIVEKNQRQEELIQIECNEKNQYVVVKYEKVLLKEYQLIDGKLQMLLPETLEPMPEEMILIKFPSVDRPEYIYTDEDENLTMTLSLEEGEVELGDIEKITDVMAGEMSRLYPASKIEEKEMLSADLGWYSLDIPLVDDECCHMMFFYGISQGLVMGTFDCTADSKKQWKPIVKQLLLSLTEKKEAEEHDPI